NQASTATSSEPDPISRLLRDAEQSCAQYSSYICRLRRREVIQGRQKPEEVILFQCRSHPFSIHFKWIGDESHGREVVYVAGQGHDRLNILTADGDIPFAPAGRARDLPIDSALTKSERNNH